MRRMLVLTARGALLVWLVGTLTAVIVTMS